LKVSSSLACAALLLAAIVALSPIALAAPPRTPGSLTTQATITPHTYTLTLHMTLNKTSKSVKAASAHVGYTYNNKTCTTNLEASIHEELAKASNSTLKASEEGVVYVNATKGLLEAHTRSQGSLVLRLIANKTNIEVSTNRSSVMDMLTNTSAGEGHTDRSGRISLYLRLVNTSQTVLKTSLDINYTSHTTFTNKSSLTKAIASGPITIEAPVSGKPVIIAFKLDSAATLNETLLSENVTHVHLEGQANLTFKDYLTAIAVYQYLNMIVVGLNLTKYVKVTPPASPAFPVVNIEVEYEGNVTPSELGHIKVPERPSGIPAPPAGIQGNATRLVREIEDVLPAAVPENLTGTLNATYKLKASYAQGVLDASLAVSARATGDFCKANYSIDKLEASVEFNNQTATESVHLVIHGRTAEPYTSALTIARFLKHFIDEAKSRVEDISVTLKTADGVRLVLNGKEYNRLFFTGENYTSLEDLEVSYGGVKVGGHARGLVVSSGPQANLTLPPIAKNVLIKGARKAVISLPIHGKLHRHLKLGVSNDIAPNATIVIHRGAKVLSKVKLATLPPSQVQLPSSIKGHKAGPALVVEGVEGPVTVVLPFKKDYPGKPAIVVVHSNGTVEVVTNVTVKDGYIIANVTASTTYTPVILASGGGGGTTTTTTKTTTTTTATTTTETTTKTTSTTKTTTTSGTTTTTKTTMTSTTTTRTATTHTTTKTPGTTTTGKTSTTKTATTTPTTTTKAKSRTTLVAAIIVVIVVIAAAAALIARR
jgi:hypothetical protein